MYTLFKYNLQPMLYLIAMSDKTVLVTRKGQVTIPVEHRKKFRIKEGMRVTVKDTDDGILITPVTPLEDLVGIDAGKVTMAEMRKKLDAMRTHDRY